MKRSKMSAQALLILAITSFAVASTSASLAQDSSSALKSGMAAFNAGRYSDAAGHFGLALTSEFNNSVLHYYLGNCYVRMNQRDSAVREFRIAYALDPEKDVGKYAKQALTGLNVDVGAAAPLPIKGASPPNQALPNPGGLPQAGSTSPAGSTGLKPRIEIGPGGKIVELPPKPLPPPLTPGRPAPLQLPRRGDESFNSAMELQRTAENLHELLTKGAKPGDFGIVPTGTNVYIRNYQTAPFTIKNKPSTAR